MGFGFGWGKRKAACRKELGKLVKIRVCRQVPPGEVLDALDRRALFAGRWGYKHMGQRQRLEMESKLAAMWGELSSPGNWSAGVVWSEFLADSRGGRLLLGGTKPATLLSIKPGALPRPAMGPTALILQAVTLGAKTTRWAKKRRRVSEKFLWHGLAAETTEALAEWCSRKAAAGMGWEEWRRISPGFPAWPELAEQKKLFRLLRPGRIGIRLKRSLLMDPEYSTLAAVYPI